MVDYRLFKCNWGWNCKAALKSGDQVIVTAKNKKKVMDIVKDYPETVLALSLDVCDNAKSINN